MHDDQEPLPDSNHKDLNETVEQADAKVRAAITEIRDVLQRHNLHSVFLTVAEVYRHGDHHHVSVGNYFNGCGECLVKSVANSAANHLAYTDSRALLVDLSACFSRRTIRNSTTN